MSLGESLSVVIGANADPLIQELNKASAAVNQWGGGVKESLESVQASAELLNGVMEGAIGGAVGFMAKSLLEGAAAAQDNAEALGMNVEKFQALRYAAQQAGVDNDKFTLGLDKLSKIFGEAMVGNGGEALKTLEKWGLVTDQAEAKTLTFETFLQRLEDRFQSITNPQLKAAAASDLMGRNMLLMANFFSQGSEKVAEFEKQARSTGAVMSSEVTEKAKQADIQIKNMADILKADLVPAVLAAKPAFEGLGQVISVTGHGLQLWMQAWKDLASGNKDPFREFLNSAKNAGTSTLPGPIPGIIAPISGSGATETTASTGTSNAAASTGFQPRDIDAEIAARKALQEAMQNTGKAFGNEYQSYQDGEAAISGYIAKLQDENAQLTMNDAERQKHVNMLNLQKIADQSGVTLTQDQIDKTNAASDANARLNQQIADTRQKLEEARQFSDQLARALTNSFEQAALAGKPLHQVFLGLLQDIEKMVVEMEIMQPLANFLGGGNKQQGAGGVIGSLLGHLPGFASGGDVSGPSIVGERGPELFIPDVGGTIVPNRSMPGAVGGSSFSPAFNMTVTVSGPAAGDPKTAATAGNAFAAAAQAQFKDWLLKEQRIGGMLWGSR